ncbi:MAG TPA: hypothetical protein VK400_06535, partial [Pyrinomonadaceae bacterium]|nr:hypothetical protein [Pyrinomonadaceae bacterium]
MVLLFIGFFVALVVVIFIVARKMRQKRIHALQVFAAQNGWTFVPNATVQTSFQNPDAYAIFNRGRRDLIALMHRQHDGGAAYVFDYAYTVGSGKNQQTYTQTVVAFNTPRLRIPFFALYPESFLSFIGEMFGYNDIDFHTHPAFSKRFKLTGRDEMPIRGIFHPQALSFFENLPNIRVDGGGNYLFVYVHNQTVKPEILNGFLATALNI